MKQKRISQIDQNCGIGGEGNKSCQSVIGLYSALEGRERNVRHHVYTAHLRIYPSILHKLLDTRTIIRFRVLEDGKPSKHWQEYARENVSVKTSHSTSRGTFST